MYWTVQSDNIEYLLLQDLTCYVKLFLLQEMSIGINTEACKHFSYPETCKLFSYTDMCKHFSYPDICMLFLTQTLLSTFRTCRCFKTLLKAALSFGYLRNHGDVKVMVEAIGSVTLTCCRLPAWSSCESNCNDELELLQYM